MQTYPLDPEAKARLRLIKYLLSKIEDRDVRKDLTFAVEDLIQAIVEGASDFRMTDIRLNWTRI